MRRLIILSAVLTALAITIAACDGGSDGNDGPTPQSNDGAELVPELTNSELVVGPNRFSLGLVDADNSSILEEPGTAAHFRFFFPDGDDGELRHEEDARFVPAVEDTSGVWVTNVDFPDVGAWRVEVTLTRNGVEETADLTFQVLEEGIAPNIGDPAPPTDNHTLDDVPDIRQISTDPEPDPSLYQMTVTQALAEGKPFVVAFATPAFCRTRYCGPVVDAVKLVKADYEGKVNFIHIEPYELDPEGQFIPGPDDGFKHAAPMIEWSLQTEPWVMVVDAQGLISARFESTAGADELREAIDAVLA